MDKPILFLKNVAQSESFTTTQGGGGGIKLPSRNRIAHATWLTQRFNEAWSKLDGQRQQRNALLLPSRDGCYLEITGHAGYELIANSLEDISSGIRLISVQEIEKDNSSESHAIVYIPSGKERKLLKKIKTHACHTDNNE